MHPLDDAWEVLKKNFDAACSQSARAARWELTNDLNQLLRRLRQYRLEGEWVSTLIESAARFVPQAAVFEVVIPAHGDRSSPLLRLRAQHGLTLPENLTFPGTEGGAFHSALNSHDPVTALRSPTEVTESLQSEDSSARAHILPVLNQQRVVALLFAAGSDYIDANALEMIAGIASIVLERGSNRDRHLHVSPPAESDRAPNAKPEPSASTQPSTPPTKRLLPAWADLPDVERSRHIQAQRFARITVAEFQLSQPDACLNGRQKGNLYLYLKRDLDRARESFRSQFMQIPSMVDYLHMELVSTAAGGDEANLGNDYPGPLA